MLCRVSNLPTVWMNVLAAIVLSSADFSLADFLLLTVALSGLYCGGMGLNDLFDREFDEVHQPYRPIPAGRISVAVARTITTACFVLGLGLLLAAPQPSAILPGAGLLALIFLYDWLHKRHPASVVLMAGCRTMVFVVVGWALTGRAEPWVVLGGGLQFAYTLLVTVVARYEGQRSGGFGFPLIPRMIASMALLDGIVLAVAVDPKWLLAGLAGAALTHLGQQYVRGD
jgi:4-hydroxybenzoate polyprenyltransferase